jgi:uncharacterized RDD family membrane protein YckC
MSSNQQPESTPSSPALARRLAALIYDTLQIIAILMLVSLPFVLLELGQGPFYQSALLLSAFAFFAKFWRHGGQTLGMKSWDIRIVGSNDQAITLMQCLLRFMAAIPSLLFFGIGYFWMLVDKDKLTWPDRFSDTRLVMTPKREKLFTKKKP